MNVLTIGGAMVDTIITIASDRIEQMKMLNAQSSYLLLEEGIKTEADQISTSTGGGAVNSAVAAARLGHATSTIVKLGEDAKAKTILDRLAEEGVDLRWIARDPDAPTGAGDWHWLAFNIPASVTSLNEGAGNQSPAGGTSATNDYGMVGYGGPCPPKGDIDHHYHFTVYALDVEKLEGPTEKTTGASLVFMMRGHVLATGKIIGTFSH